MGKNEACGVVAGGGVAIGVGDGSFVDEGERSRKTCGGDSDRTELTRDLVGEAFSVAGVQRKKRMARQRRSSVSVLPFSPYGSHVPTPPLARVRVHPHFYPISRLKFKKKKNSIVIDETRLKFLFEKELQMSDVSSLRRMVVPKKSAEAFLPALVEKEGFFMSMHDMDGLHVWNFRFRFVLICFCFVMEGISIAIDHGWYQIFCTKRILNLPRAVPFLRFENLLKLPYLNAALMDFIKILKRRFKRLRMLSQQRKLPITYGYVPISTTDLCSSPLIFLLAFSFKGSLKARYYESSMHRSFISDTMKYWPNNTSRMYVLENTGEFVNTHGLTPGDYMMIYQDPENQNYFIQARKATDQESHSDSAANAVNDYFPDDYEVINFEHIVPMEYPTVDDTMMPLVYQTTFSSDSSDASYVYETTISNETVFDFWSGPMIYNSRVERAGSFESIENLSLDEF
ncbi:hypothetical protein RHSIM_Rhsim08G0040100 [Rhododendron simsii]|uniref:TF-B3 domain-containing protein n=1 Tax=Rhododendron simsii TaxID=118357 RepID=A0A834LDK9_RHOSS|nr:hypothetical protein RHSIM_Rhsim08G0040100 [Rhododendron simsii]